MKRSFKFIFTLVMIVLCMIFSSFSVFADSEAATINEEKKESEIEWVEIDGLNYDDCKSEYTPNIVVYNNELYVTCFVQDRENKIHIRVKKYDGSKWVEIDNGGLNYDSSKNARYQNAVVYNNELYIAWMEYENSDQKIRIKKYDGNKWLEVDNGGLNYDASKDARYPKAIVYNNELYVTWMEEDINTIDKIRVKKYDGSKWIGVDDGGLNYDNSKNSYYPNVREYNNELYITWTEADRNNKMQVRVKKYNGSTWVEVDGGGLNCDNSKYAEHPNVEVYNNELYITWTEADRNNKMQVRVKKYNGSTWIEVDNGGLNYDGSKRSESANIIVYNRELYIAWNEMFRNDKMQVRVKKYDGSKWVEVDNAGLNYDVSKDARYANTVVYDDELYIAWNEKNESNLNQIRMKKLVNNKGTGSEKPSNKGERALLRITMEEGTEKEYDMTIKEVNDFIDWYNKISTPCYAIEKDYNIGPFESRKDYIVRDKIVSFEVMEYNK